ncbi:MAG: hypothetical protein ABIS18_09510 [Actinomycetota bacterium]
METGIILSDGPDDVTPVNVERGRNEIAIPYLDWIKDKLRLSLDK